MNGLYERIDEGTFYVALDEAKEALLARKSLRTKVAESWSRGLPPLPQMETPAFLARQIATASYEDLLFKQMAEKVGLVPCWLEYNADKFVRVSREKMRYLSYLSCTGRGRNGGLKLQRVTIADPNNWDGRSLNEIVDKDGRPLVDYHHALQDKIIPGAWRADFSEWLKKIGGAANYYFAYLAMAVAHGVLFEDFHGAKAESKFLYQVVTPAWRLVEGIFHVEPLIVRLPYAPERDYFPDPNSDWRAHGLIPSEFLS